MKKRRKYVIIAVLLIAVILTVLYILIFFHRKDIEDADGKIHIPRNIQLEEGETVEIILPEIIISLSHGDINDIVKEIEENFEQEDVYANEDGTITEILTQEQLEQRIQMPENGLESKINESENIKIVIDDRNFDEVSYFVSENCNFLDIGLVLLNIRYNLILAQIYSGIPHDEWKIDEKIIYEDGNIVMFEFHLREGGSLDISASEWNAKMQELSGE